MIQQNATCPWNVPVRIEPGDFVPLHSRHAQFNIQVAPSRRYEPESVQAPEDSLLFADIQTSLSTHMVGRLGSGRAGFFRGHYLKGVGRTPLAANWNRGDRWHSSGHLSASSAIREYVVSLYLKSRGCETSIVACDGVLLAELAPGLRKHVDASYVDRDPDLVPEVDRYLQALTVKAGGFARQSNFVWFLHHLTPGYIDDGNCGLALFCELLAAALRPPADHSMAHTDATASGLAALLAGRLRLAWDHFRQWFAAGVWWGSFTNNFTLDGRFLDLETPALLMGPCFGRLSATSGGDTVEHDVRSMIGVELFTFIAHVRVFCLELRRALAGLPRWFSPMEREFAAELANEIALQVLAPDQPLGSRTYAVAWIHGMLEEAFGCLSATDQAAIEALVDCLYERELGDVLDASGDRGRPSATFGAVLDAPWLLVEPGLRCRLSALKLDSGRLLAPSHRQRRDARAIAELIAELDHTIRLPLLLDKLATLSKSTTLV